MSNNTEYVKRFSERDIFAGYVGIDLIEARDGRATAKMEINENHLNGLKTVHGGAIFTLADYTFAAAANSHGTIAVAINTGISFIKAATNGILTAQAEEISRNAKLATYTVAITDENGDLVANFNGMVYRKKERIHPD